MASHLERWNIGMSLKSKLIILFFYQKKFIPTNNSRIFPISIIPFFQLSIIPVMSEAK